MFDNAPIRQMDADALIRLRDSAYATDMFIAAAIWLDLFTRLSERPRTLDELCRDLDTAPRPTETMVHLFLSWGLVEEREGRYATTGVADRHLVKGAPQSLLPYFASLKERPTVRDMLDYLRLSHSEVWREKREQEKAKWSELMQRPDFADFYTAGMDSRGSVLGVGLAAVIDLKGRKRLLDVAGGSGIYASKIVEAHPGIGASVLERPPVDEVARKMLDRQGLGGRIGVVGADMFTDPFPKGYDVHLFSHILHDWPMPKVRMLVAKSFEALDPGGMIAIYSAHLNDGGAGPVAVAEYSVLMTFLYEGRCYTTTEMEEVLAEAGFRNLRITPSIGNRSLITAGKPA